jgi:hypothetical protein
MRSPSKGELLLIEGRIRGLGGQPIKTAHMVLHEERHTCTTSYDLYITLFFFVIHLSFALGVKSRIGALQRLHFLASWVRRGNLSGRSRGFGCFDRAFCVSVSVRSPGHGSRRTCSFLLPGWAGWVGFLRQLASHTFLVRDLTFFPL